MAVREVKGAHLGKLITVRGIVTRVSEVKPLLLVNAYTCDVCGSETFQEISRKEFTPIADCQNENECVRNNIKGSLHMQTRACRFSPFQEVKIQEMVFFSLKFFFSLQSRFAYRLPLPQADQVPVGHIPRSMTVHVNGSLTRTMNPGDMVHLGGTFLPIPYTGFQAVRAGLLTDTYLDVHHIHQLKKQYSEMEVTTEMRAAIERLHDDPTVYQKLAFSIAPEIYGHVDVKKALLLLLVGGVTKSMGDGMKIRGDINICLMGDPGVAKSQLLKYISKVAPRGVYTTGKGSSGVGLTAAVMRDPVTDEMVLGAFFWFSFQVLSDPNPQRVERSSWLITEYAVSTSLTKWKSQTGRPSTKSWSNRRSPSQRPVSRRLSTRAPRSWPQPTPYTAATTPKYRPWKTSICPRRFYPVSTYSFYCWTSPRATTTSDSHNTSPMSTCTTGIQTSSTSHSNQL